MTNEQTSQQTTQPGTSRRLEILEASLKKKEAEFDRLLGTHFSDVRGSQGQPMYSNTRGGRAVLNRWEKQNDTLLRHQAGIEKTKDAIEREKFKISRVESQDLPQAIIDLLEDGTLTQWRKFPNRFFVKGVEKARIIWDEKKQKILSSYVNAISDPEKSARFSDVFNGLERALAA